jgi:hypothetical protein
MCFTTQGLARLRRLKPVLMRSFTAELKPVLPVQPLRRSFLVTDHYSPITTHCASLTPHELLVTRQCTPRLDVLT